MGSNQFANVYVHLGQQRYGGQLSPAYNDYTHPWYNESTKEYQLYIEPLSLPLNLAKHVSNRLFITSEAKRLLEKLGRFPSAPIMRLGVFKRHDESTYRICLMSKNDYHYAFCHRDVWLDHYFDDLDPNLKADAMKETVSCVYSFDTSPKTESPLGLLADPPFYSRQPDFDDKGLILQCAHMRLFMDLSNFSSKERNELKGWVLTLKDKDYAEVIGALQSNANDSLKRTISEMRT